MKKSALITFGVIMSALILCSCENRCCVDAQGKVVDEKKCKEEEEKARGTGSSGHGGGYVGRTYFWYYGGTHGGMGTRASGGSFTAGVSRGGFGAIGAAHAAGS